MKVATNIIKGSLVSIVMFTAVGLWLLGMMTSPITSPQNRQQRLFVDNYIQNNAPDLEKVRLLAEIYWQRYPDVGSDAHFGRHGIMGIYGARAHYDQHGKIEGRRWGY